MLFLGIDPGQAGAISAIDKNRNIIHLSDWPGDEVKAAEEIRSLINRTKMDFSQMVAVIEKVSAMPKQGVVSMFKFGTNYGIWKGILASMQIPFQEVPPQRWQKGVISRAQDKKPAVAAAGRLFPHAELYGPRGGAKDGRADALLIADYCRRMYMQ